MAASYSNPISPPFFSPRHMSIPPCTSSSVAGYHQSHSRSTPTPVVSLSRVRVRVFQPPAVLTLSEQARKRRSVYCSAVKMIGESEFEGEVLGSNMPVLVDFVADWCGPCRLISPIIEWASQEYSERLKIFKIDHDSNPKLIEEYKVYGLPTLILFRDGKEVPESRREGVITKVKLRDYLDSLLGSTTAV